MGQLMVFCRENRHFSKKAEIRWGKNMETNKRLNLPDVKESRFLSCYVLKADLRP